MNAIAGVSDVEAERSLKERLVLGLNVLLVLLFLSVEDEADVYEVQYQCFFVLPQYLLA